MNQYSKEQFGETNSFEDEHTSGVFGINITRGDEPMIIAACRGVSKLTVTFHNPNTSALLESALVRLVVDGLMNQVTTPPPTAEGSDPTTYSD